METTDCIIEIGCEDLPSWTGKYLKERWIPLVENMLKDNRVEYTSLRFFYTSRRLILYFSNLSIRQKDVIIEISGPSVETGMDKEGNFTAAARGFADANKTNVKELFIKEKKGRKVFALLKKEKGMPVKNIIGDILAESIRKTEIPRAMKWQDGEFKFIRPVRWILALLGRDVVKIQLAGVRSGRHSFGHRVLSPGKFSPSSPVEYLDMVLKNFVIFDEDLRLEFVKAQIEKEVYQTISFDEKHLSEILNTSEYPFVLKCPLTEEYMNMPSEIVSAVILKLNGLPLFDNRGALQPFYISISDGVKGNEIKENYLSVLSSKMDDAIFFMQQDMAIPFANYTENLKKISYHPRWGSIYDRVLRFRKIADIFLQYLPVEEKSRQDIYTIISLCKNDLATLMVAEFPSLEGIIGRIYAKKNGFNDTISEGIEQHYLPKSSNGQLPNSNEASIVSLVVRLESLCGMFLDNIEIKGTGDPYGVKKIANGFIEILWHEKIDIPLGEIIAQSLSVFTSNIGQTADNIKIFLLQRVENLLAGEGLSPGIRKAVISAEKDNLLNIRLKADALKKFFSGGQAQNILVPFIRVANILKQAEEKKIEVNNTIDENLLSEEMEKKLYDFYKNNKTILSNSHNKREYLVFLENLANWRDIIDRFFDEILVMHSEENIRNNRLALLQQINNIFSLFADFSLIPIVEVENA